MTSRYLIRFDGGSRGNPGKAGCGYVIYKPDGSLHLRGACFVGLHETNNVAEYSGLLRALEALSMDDTITCLQIEGDSLLVINQLNGKWKVKADNLLPLYNSVSALLKKYDFTVQHIPRKENAEADSLANVAMDSISENSN